MPFNSKSKIIAFSFIALSTAYCPFSFAQPSGVETIKEVMGAIKSEDYSALSEAARIALESGLRSGQISADFKNATPQDLAAANRASQEFSLAAKKAYVAALPLRDQARGRSIILGDGTDDNFGGQLFIFVSRSMPKSLLRAYAVDALYSGASLVVKGLRPGDTITEYVTEAIADFNSSNGQTLASMDINPNLFDIFDVKVVPTVVWSNKLGLSDLGAGCEPLAEGVLAEKLNVPGPDGLPVVVARPTCAPAPTSSFYKISGALAMSYVIERFEAAGAPVSGMNILKSRMTKKRLLNQSAQPAVGNEQVAIDENISLEELPRHVLEQWKIQLASKIPVQRTSFGPAFLEEATEDAEYRIELEGRVQRGLAL